MTVYAILVRDFSKMMIAQFLRGNAGAGCCFSAESATPEKR